MLQRRALRPALAVILLLLAAGVFALAACSRRTEAPGPLAMDQAENERWEIALVEMRIEKNEAFATPGRSPLAADRIPGFEGLNYYFPEPGLRFRTPLVPAAHADTVMLAKAKGPSVPYVRRGSVAFRHEGRDYTLAVFGPAGGPGLWVPFFDASNRDETYQGGRYLDLEADADGMIDLDFNYAYNPYCDYDADRWNCTLPPAENALPFAVTAGEKRFSAGH
ncbi:MAG TPA: DUF1684 domain-containing protein [Candidatus Krumholzibacteria bacterium]|nr:DUF1684 domain-containing protein [Candidatus Krumholzibacteria bacterium]